MLISLQRVDSTASDGPSVVSTGDPQRFDGALGTVVAWTSVLDIHGHGFIEYAGQFWKFKALQAIVGGTEHAISTLALGDPFLRVSLLQHPIDPLLFALMFDDPYWGRNVGGNKTHWMEASAFTGFESVVFTMGWETGTLTVKKGGVLQTSTYVDFEHTWETDDGDHDGWDQPAYPYDGWPGGPVGKYRTDGLGIVKRIFADLSTGPVIFPKGLGARGHRGAVDGWPSAPEAERRLASVRMKYLGEFITVTEGAGGTIDLAGTSLTIDGPANANYRAFQYGGPSRDIGQLSGGGTVTITDLVPGVYTVHLWHPSDSAKGLPATEVDCPDSGGTYSVDLGSSWTDYTEDFYTVQAYHGADPLDGATVYAMESALPNAILAVGTTDSGGGMTFGPIGDWVTPFYIRDPRGSATLSGQAGARYWDPRVSARILAVGWAPEQEFPPDPEGLVPWGAAGDHVNFLASSNAAYLIDEFGKRWNFVPTPNGMGVMTDELPRYHLGDDFSFPAADISYQPYEADGTILGTPIALPNHSFPPWTIGVGVDTFEFDTEGTTIHATTGGKINGAGWEADRSQVIDADNGPKEVHRLGGEFGDWEIPLEHRHSTGPTDEASRALTFDTQECPNPACRGQVWLEPSNATWTRYFCADGKTWGGILTDARASFSTRTLASVAWRNTVVKSHTSGMTLKRLIDQHFRPEEYDETGSYLVNDWLGLGADRWVAIHIVLGTFAGGTFTDGESIADVETRLSRTVGPVMLKLELTSPYSGTGKTVSVTATHVIDGPKTLTVIVLPGSQAGDWIPIDWHPHHAYFRGFYTDVTNVTATGDGACNFTVVNDGPAMRDADGTTVTNSAYVPWACDVQLSSRDPHLFTGPDTRNHIVYIRDGSVMHAFLDAKGVWSDPVNVTVSAGVVKSHRDPTIVVTEQGEILVSADNGVDDSTPVYVSWDDGVTWFVRGNA